MILRLFKGRGMVSGLFEKRDAIPPHLKHWVRVNSVLYVDWKLWSSTATDRVGLPDSNSIVLIGQHTFWSRSIRICLGTHINTYTGPRRDT
jgi:hypothetical protein